MTNPQPPLAPPPGTSRRKVPAKLSYGLPALLLAGVAFLAGMLGAFTRNISFPYRDTITGAAIFLCLPAAVLAILAITQPAQRTRGIIALVLALVTPVLMVVVLRALAS